MPIDNRISDELQRALRKHADTKSALMTDEWQAYRRPGCEFASHETVVIPKKNGPVAKPEHSRSKISAQFLKEKCAVAISIAARNT
jgi:hypothetical protein